MKELAKFIFPTVKAVIQVTAFFVGIGWASYGAIMLIVKAEGKDIKVQVMEVRRVDMEHLEKRFDRVDRKLDLLINQGRLHGR